MQTLNPSVLRQASGMLHVIVEATQFVVDCIGRMTLHQSTGILEQRQHVS
jgi:hypothetical protein